MSVRLPVWDGAVAERIAEQLRPHVRGEIRFSPHDRLLYSTDASIYQVEPIGVICPADEADVESAVSACARLGVPVLPRGGGTSLAGQCTNRAVVMDLSVNLRGISGEFASGRLRAQAGTTIDRINRALLPSRRFFAPDPATSAQATLGGCIGNNAAGARSLKYGRTSENIAAIEALLATGQHVCFRTGAARDDSVARSLSQRVAQVVRSVASEIRRRFARTIRRNAGYGLDLILQQMDRGIGDEELDLTGLICGSEGTLAVATAATLRLHPLPAARGLAVISFATLEQAIELVPAINASGASAVELLDDVVLTAAAGNIECQRYLQLVPRANSLPAATLYVEYEAASNAAELGESFDQLRKIAGAHPATYHTDQASISQLWALRKAGEPLLHRIGGGEGGRARPQTFVEDNAIPVERLGEFIGRFKEIVARHGTTAAYYAHASVGVLHVRPLIDLHSQADRKKLREIAIATADLARDCGGVMSGEHGDGRVRGPLLERFYGPEIMRAFRQIKAIFDPQNLLNPGMIVDPQPIENVTENLRIDRERLSRQLNSIDTYFDYSDQHGFEGAVEMCNGAAVCRKMSGGTMCPSYRATLDERHSTRGRGNALRAAITGQVRAGNEPAWDDPETIQTLHLCLSCKACKSECPSSVDVARLKAEYTAQRYRAHRPSLQAYLLGHVRALNRLGSLAPGMSSALARSRPLRAIVNRLLGIAPERSLPEFGAPLRRWFERRSVRDDSDAPAVVLYEDCFAGFNEPHIGRAAVRLLEALGYRVMLPRAGCCGRAMISTGFAADAIAAADRALGILGPLIEDARVRAVLFLEPSCLSAIRDDWLQLRLDTPLERRQRLASKAMMVEEFVERDWAKHPRRPGIARAGVVAMHGHCHQKALWGQDGSASALRRVAAEVKLLPTGCCGMAGSFGFTADRYDVSLKIAQMSLVPEIRNAGAGATIVAAGTSCRHQIWDVLGIRALHPAEVVARAMGTADV